MIILNELKRLRETKKQGVKHSLTLTDEMERVYKLEVKFNEDEIEYEGIYINPTGTGGFKNLLKSSIDAGFTHIVIAKVVNSRFAEYLSASGWKLKANGEWIEFHLNYEHLDEAQLRQILHPLS